MRRIGMCVAALLLSSCAYSDAMGLFSTGESSENHVDIDLVRAEEPPLHTVTVPPPNPDVVERVQIDAGARADAALVEEEVRKAIVEQPELAAQVESLQVDRTDYGLSVGGVVTSQEAFDDVIDLVQLAAPGVNVVNDLVIVIELT